MNRPPTPPSPAGRPGGLGRPPWPRAGRPPSPRPPRPRRRLRRSPRPSPPCPIFSSEVQLITVDAVVLDKKHRPVPGLTRDDFVVTEDGRPVEIVSFEAFAQPESEPEEEPGGSLPRRHERPAHQGQRPRLRRAGGRPQHAAGALRRTLGAPSARSSRPACGTATRSSWARRAATSGGAGRIPEAARGPAVRPRAHARQVRGALLVQPDDRVRGLPDRQLRGLARVRRERARADRALSGRRPASPKRCPRAPAACASACASATRTSMLCQGPSCEPMVHGRAMQVDAARRSRVQSTLAGVARGLEALRGIHGRKSLLLFSDGFITDASDRRTREVVALSREANTAVYFLDIRGLDRACPAPASDGGGSGPGSGRPDGDRDRRTAARPASRSPCCPRRAPRASRPTPAASRSGTRTTSAAAPAASPTSRASSTCSASTRPRASRPRPGAS